MTTTFTSGVERELDRPLPRPVRLTGTGIGRFVVSALLVAGGVAAAIDGAMAGHRRDVEEDAEARQMLAQGQEAEAVVTHLWFSHGGKSTRYYVAYRYTVSGQDYDAHASIAKQHWKSLQVGSPLAIRYLAPNPTHVYPSADPPRRLPMWLPPVIEGGALAVIGAFLLLMLWRQRHLLAYGISVAAVVTRRVGTKYKNGSVTYTVYYEYPLLAGGSCQGKFDASLGRRQPPPEGSVISIVYDRDSPRRNAPYPMGLVKVATS